MLSEATLIAKLQAEFPTHIGDDAAVIPYTQDQSYIITKDLLIENIHFRTTYVAPHHLAHKALQVNLSDIAAMGATPHFILLGLSIPLAQSEYAQQFIEHFSACCHDARVIVIGGDTTCSPTTLFISITAIGIAANNNIKYRHTAKPTDLICVAGHLGYAHLGWLACEKSISGFENYQQHFLKPVAKLKESAWLSTQGAVTSMMDLSDGLYLDLKRLCKAAGVKAQVELTLFTPTADFIRACTTLGSSQEEAQLIGGEDYGLLFTIQASAYQNLANQFMQQFGYKVKCLGSLTQGEGVYFNHQDDALTFKYKPFTHFGEDDAI